jgi:hypothetical protein
LRSAGLYLFPVRLILHHSHHGNLAACPLDGSTFALTPSYSYTDHRKTSLLVSHQHQFSHHSGDSYLLGHLSCCWWQVFQALLDIRYLRFDLETPRRHDRLRPPMAPSSRVCAWSLSTVNGTRGALISSSELQRESCYVVFHWIQKVYHSSSFQGLASDKNLHPLSCLHTVITTL